MRLNVEYSSICVNLDIKASNSYVVCSLAMVIFALTYYKF